MSNRITLPILMADRSKLACNSSSERVRKRMSYRYILYFCLPPSQPDRFAPLRPLRLTPYFHACRRTFSLLTFIFGIAFFSNLSFWGVCLACSRTLSSSICCKDSTTRRNQPCAKQEKVMLKAPRGSSELAHLSRVAQAFKTCADELPPISQAAENMFSSCSSYGSLCAKWASSFNSYSSPPEHMCR